MENQHTYPNKHIYTTSKVIHVLKTKHGYLHRDLSEGWWIEEDSEEVNYTFTDDPLDAYEFSEKGDKVPKYLGMTSPFKLNTTEDCCHFLQGKIVKIQVERSVSWEEIE